MTDADAGRIVIVGGTGLIGAKLVPLLVAAGREVVVAARSTGVNSFTGEGLADALDGASTIVDVSNSSYTDEAGAQEFFETSTLNLLSYGAAAGISHHVSISVVGTDRLARSEHGYFAAKQTQEDLVRESRIPHSTVHATQFFEFVRSIGESATRDGRVRLAHALIRPMAADDVAAALAQVALGDPTNGTVEVAGPDEFRLEDLVRRELAARRDSREVVADPLARYFGSELGERDLLPGVDASIYPTRFEDWLRETVSSAIV